MQVARIFCDKTPYMLPEGEHTGTNLRSFFSAEAQDRCGGSEWDLFRRVDDVLIPDTDDKFSVKDGDAYYTVSRKINQS